MTMFPWQRGRLYQSTPNCMLWWSFFTKLSQAIWSAVLLSLQERNVGLGWGKYQFGAGAKKWHSVTTVGSPSEVLDSWAKNYLWSGAVQERTEVNIAAWAGQHRGGRRLSVEPGVCFRPQRQRKISSGVSQNGRGLAFGRKNVWHKLDWQSLKQAWARWLDSLIAQHWF